MPAPAFPLHVSSNRRHLEGAQGRPFFVHADTGWRLLIELERDDALHYLDDRQARGFNALHIHAINKEKSGSRNRARHEPFFEDDLSRPNEPYWAHSEDILSEAQARGFFVLLSAVWFGYGGAGWRRHFHEQNAQVYGRFLGERFGRFQNIAWILGGDNDPDAHGDKAHNVGDKRHATRMLSRALRQSAPHHLQTYHAGPEHTSAFWFGDEDWLDFNLAYTCEPAHKQVAQEWRREPARPVLLGETGYEGEGNTGFRWDASLVRRQAWSAVLAGACGQAHGSARVWDFAPRWREALDYGSSRQARHLREMMERLEWWRLVPDLEHGLVREGWASFAGAEDIVAARAEDGSFALIYAPVRRSFTVDLRRMRNPQAVRARWLDPTDGSWVEHSHATAFVMPEEDGRHRFRAHGPNSAHDGDWALLLES